MKAFGISNFNKVVSLCVDRAVHLRLVQGAVVRNEKGDLVEGGDRWSLGGKCDGSCQLYIVPPEVEEMIRQYQSGAARITEVLIDPTVTPNAKSVTGA